MHQKTNSKKINWIVGLFVLSVNTSTRLRQMLWHWVYNKIAQKDTSGKFLFMNYGFHDESDILSLQSDDESNRYFIQLYDHVVKNINMQGKDVIEVGCGRGGGGAYFLKYKQPLSYTGIDLSEKAIAWCQQKFNDDHARWIQGFADALPIPDSSMDILVNVESSHCYPSMEKFLKEACRVLRHNGYMAFCDLRQASEVATLEENIVASGFHIVHQHEITSQVLNALDHVSQIREKQIKLVFPSILQPAMCDFAAVKDTTIYNMLQTGEMKYLSYLLQKKM